jgi:putative spermidine/putrescine transport system substrate-binding protein
MSRLTTDRRTLLAGAGAAFAVSGFPNIVRAQSREIFIGGPASPGLTDVLFPMIEKKHNMKILFEGTNSLINLEKIRNNKDRPTMTVTMMDDPVLVLAQREKLIQKLPAEVTALADLPATAKPADGMWANWCQPMCSASHNTQKVKTVESYGDFWDKKYRDGLILISMRITQAVAPLLAATQLATGKPLAECLKFADEGFGKLRELKPNILQVSTNAPQAQQLLETGECLAYLAPDSRTTLFRKAAGAPVDQSYPKEGVIAMPAGVALVTNGPNRDLGVTFINELLNPETQAMVAKTFYSKPTNSKTVLPAGLSFPDMVVLDWEYFADNRNKWIERFEREVSSR